MKAQKHFISLLSVLVLSFLLFTAAYSQQYILIGWNDLGMHCANKDFSKIAVLPPFNNVYAQLILKQPGQYPQIVNVGYKIEYNIPFNTYSVGKTNFWTYRISDCIKTIPTRSIRLRKSDLVFPLMKGARGMSNLSYSMFLVVKPQHSSTNNLNPEHIK